MLLSQLVAAGRRVRVAVRRYRGDRPAQRRSQLAAKDNNPRAGPYRLRRHLDVSAMLKDGGRQPGRRAAAFKNWFRLAPWPRPAPTAIPIRPRTERASRYEKLGQAVPGVPRRLFLVRRWTQLRVWLWYERVRAT